MPMVLGATLLGAKASPWRPQVRVLLLSLIRFQRSASTCAPCYLPRGYAGDMRCEHNVHSEAPEMLGSEPNSS